MLLDAFMGFLVLVGGVQFVYCVVGGNYVSLLPFPFLSPFIMDEGNGGVYVWVWLILGICFLCIAVQCLPEWFLCCCRTVCSYGEFEDAD